MGSACYTLRPKVLSRGTMAAGVEKDVLGAGWAVMTFKKDKFSPLSNDWITGSKTSTVSACSLVVGSERNSKLSKMTALDVFRQVEMIDSRKGLKKVSGISLRGKELFCERI